MKNTNSSKKRRATIEKWWPLSVFVLSIILLFAIQPPVSLYENKELDATTIVNGGIAVSGIMIAFVATNLSILYVLPKSKFTQFVIKAKGVTRLIDYMKSAIWWWVAALLIGVLILYLSSVQRVSVDTLLTLWIAVFAGATAMFVRSVSLNSLLLSESARAAADEVSRGDLIDDSTP